MAERLNAAVLKTVVRASGPRVRIPPSPLIIFVMYFVYILRSLKSKRFYFGHTKNLENRLKQHNAGKVRSTKGYRPWTIHYTEKFLTKSEAFKREMFFKTIEGRKWLKDNQII